MVFGPEVFRGVLCIAFPSPLVTVCFACGPSGPFGSFAMWLLSSGDVDLAGLHLKSCRYMLENVL